REPRCLGAAMACSARGLLLADLSLELAHPRRELVILGLGQEGIEAAAMIYGLERVRRHPQLDRAAERIRHQRHIDQIRQETPLGLAVGMADSMADQDALTSQFAAA